MNKSLLIISLGFIWSIAHGVSADMLHSSFWADYHLFGKKPQIAFEWYKKLLEGKKPPAYMYRGLVQLLSQSDNAKQIVLLMPSLEAAFKDDIEMQLIFARALQQTGHHKAADEKMLQLLTKAPGDPQVVFNTVQVYLRNKEFQKALAALSTFIDQTHNRMNNHIFHFLKAQIYLSMDKKPEALAETEKSLELYPTFEKGWLLYALLHEQLGALKKAIKGYTSYLELTGGSPEIQEHLLRLSLKQRILDTNAKEVYVSQSHLEQAMVLFKQKKFKEALDEVDKAISKDPHDTDAKLFKIQVLNSIATPQALAQLHQWLKKQPTSQLWLQTMHMLATQHNAEQEAINILRDIQQRNPAALYIALYLADLYARIDQVKQAITQHKKALALTRDPQMQAKIVAHLGAIYYDHDMLKQMPALIKQAETINSSFAPLVNLMAYWYATDGNNLAHAQKLMQRITDREHPCYMDTQAMIYYKQHDYHKACQLLERSAQLAPDEPLIIEHLSNAYYKLGKNKQAIDTLQQAALLAQTEHEKNCYQQRLITWKKQKK